MEGGGRLQAGPGERGAVKEIGAFLLILGDAEGVGSAPGSKTLGILVSLVQKLILYLKKTQRVARLRCFFRGFYFLWALAGTAAHLGET